MGRQPSTIDPIYNKDRWCYVLRMIDSPLYSRAQLATISGAPEDAIVFWLRNDLLVWTDRGERKHRRFSRREVMIAAVLKEARDIGMNVGMMRVVAAKLRSSAEIYTSISHVPDHWDIVMEAKHRAQPRTDEEREYLLKVGRQVYGPDWEDLPFVERAKKSADLTEDQVELIKISLPLAADIAANHWIEYQIGSDFYDTQGVLRVYKNDDGEVVVESGGDETFPGTTAVIFNLGRILSLQWPGEES